MEITSSGNVSDYIVSVTKQHAPDRKSLFTPAADLQFATSLLVLWIKWNTHCILYDYLPKSELRESFLQKMKVHWLVVNMVACHHLVVYNRLKRHHISPLKPNQYDEIPHYNIHADIIFQYNPKPSRSLFFILISLKLIKLFLNSLCICTGLNSSLLIWSLKFSKTQMTINLTNKNLNFPHNLTNKL
jgi:hypothetical protein